MVRCRANALEHVTVSYTALEVCYVIKKLKEVDRDQILLNEQKE